jgi:hypothetical protein
MRAADNRYLHVGVIVLAISGAAAIYLNFQGVSCLAALGRADGDSVFSQGQVEELERNCFIVTNSYVYSLFGVAAGAILIVLWIAKKRKGKDAP